MHTLALSAHSRSPPNRKDSNAHTGNATAACLDLGSGLVLLALFGGVHTLSDQGAGFITPLAGHLLAHVGPLAQRQQLFLAVKETLEPPELAAGRGHLKKQAGTVEQLHRLVGGLGISDGNVG